jgi:hypothetical protein
MHTEGWCSDGEAICLNDVIINDDATLYTGNSYQNKWNHPFSVSCYLLCPGTCSCVSRACFTRRWRILIPKLVTRRRHPRYGRHFHCQILAAPLTCSAYDVATWDVITGTAVGGCNIWQWSCLGLAASCGNQYVIGHVTLNSIRLGKVRRSFVNRSFRRARDCSDYRLDRMKAAW